MSNENQHVNVLLTSKVHNQLYYLKKKYRAKHYSELLEKILRENNIWNDQYE